MRFSSSNLKISLKEVNCLKKASIFLLILIVLSIKVSWKGEKHLYQKKASQSESCYFWLKIKTYILFYICLFLDWYFYNKFLIMLN